jgi:hypothetical protein
VETCASERSSASFRPALVGGVRRSTRSLAVTEGAWSSRWGVGWRVTTLVAAVAAAASVVATAAAAVAVPATVATVAVNDEAAVVFPKEGSCRPPSPPRRLRRRACRPHIVSLEKSMRVAVRAARSARVPCGKCLEAGCALKRQRRSAGGEELAEKSPRKSANSRAARLGGCSARRRLRRRAFGPGRQ